MIAERTRGTSFESGNAVLSLSLNQRPQEFTIFDCVAMVVHSSDFGGHFLHLQGRNVFPFGPEPAAANVICFFEADLGDELRVAPDLNA